MSRPRHHYNITVIGDSIGQTSNYPDHLESRLKSRGINADVTDLTISGKTSSYAVQAAKDISCLREKPDLVILELGGNDILSNRSGQHGISAQTTRQNLETAIQTLQTFGVKVMLAGIQAPPFAPPEYRREFNSIVPDLARKYNLVADPLFISPVINNPNGRSPSEIFNQAAMADQVHPNNLGGMRIADRMVSFVERALDISSAPLPQPALAR